MFDFNKLKLKCVWPVNLTKRGDKQLPETLAGLAFSGKGRERHSL